MSPRHFCSVGDKGRMEGKIYLLTEMRWVEERGVDIVGRRSFMAGRYFMAAFFCRYEKQRTIMRTGHSPMFAYLLMSGSVFLNIELKSQDDEKKKFVKTAAVLQKGSLFGVRMEQLIVEMVVMKVLCM